MCVRVRGQEGQDGGNKGDEGEAEVHLKNAKAVKGQGLCQSSFPDYDKSQTRGAQTARRQVFAYLRPRMFCASRRISASTPAAVTSPPAPAPRTTIGYSRYRSV